MKAAAAYLRQLSLALASSSSRATPTARAALQLLASACKRARSACAPKEMHLPSISALLKSISTFFCMERLCACSESWLVE